MKKFYLLFKKELKELFTPQLWVPFLAVMVVFFLFGNIAGKQAKEQAAAKESIVLYDADNSQLSRESINVINQIADVKEVDVSDSTKLLNEMKNKNIDVGIIIPEGFENNIKNIGNANLDTYALIENFSIISQKKYAILEASKQAVNDFISSILINQATGTQKALELKNPITSDSYVSSHDKVVKGNPSEVLGYIQTQTSSIPVVLFIVIIMAAQMIAAAVATEKENKTLETLLSLPISRKTIAASKMLAAGLISLLMAGIYMLGLRSFNSGISSNFSQASTQTSASASQIAGELGLKITTLGYLEVGILLFLGILLALAMAMILGAFSEDAKSAQGVVAPLMILVLIPYFINLFFDIGSFSQTLQYIIYAIPFTHVLLSVQNVLLGNQLLIIFGGIYLLILFVIFVLIAAKIFSSDLILTMKLNFGKKKK